MRRSAGALSRAQGSGRGTRAEPPAGIEGPRRLTLFLRLLLLALALTGITLAVQSGPWRYHPAPGLEPVANALATPDRLLRLSRGVRLIERDGEPAAVLPGGVSRFTFLGRIVGGAPAMRYARFSLDMKVDGLVPRKGDGRGVLARATAFDQKGRRLRNWPHDIFDGVMAPGDWRRGGIVVPWTDEIGLMRLELANFADGGDFLVRRITIEPLTDAPWYPPARIALIVAWIALVGAAGWLALKHLRPLLATRLATLTALGLLVAAIVPQPLFTQLTGSVEQPLSAAVRSTTNLVPPRPPPTQKAPESHAAPPAAESPPTAPGDAPAAKAGAPAEASQAAGSDAVEVARDGASWLRRKLEGNTLHAAGFGFLALLVAALARWPLTHVAAGLAALAVTTEAVQLFTITRDADPGDLVVDATGMAIGVLAGYGLRHILRRMPGLAPGG